MMRSQLRFGALWAKVPPMPASLLPSTRTLWEPQVKGRSEGLASLVREVHEVRSFDVQCLTVRLCRLGFRVRVKEQGSRPWVSLNGGYDARRVDKISIAQGARLSPGSSVECLRLTEIVKQVFWRQATMARRPVSVRVQAREAS